MNHIIPHYTSSSSHIFNSFENTLAYLSTNDISALNNTCVHSMNYKLLLMTVLIKLR